MASKSLDVSHVLMAADPAYPHWKEALAMAEAIGEQGVRVTLACVREPSVTAAAKARRIPNVTLRVEGASAKGIYAPQEWLLFLEQLIKPDLVQLFMPEHASLIWRSPTVLKVTDYSLGTMTRALLEGIACSDLLVVDSESKLEKLRHLGDDQTYAAVIPNDRNMGRGYLLAYQETVQICSLDIPMALPGRFELI